jgi:signal transduction histidine kinase
MAGLDGLPIGENMGSCATAVFRREPVICADVGHGPEWANFLDVAAALDIKSCWSTPFFSSTDQVLGSFAITHAYACAPTRFDYQLLQTASYLASIATENHLFETEMSKEQKLESVGLLAGGIAHGFNNLLTAIMGNVQLAAQLVASDSDVHKLLAAATTASVRAREVTQQLLTFPSGGEPVTAAEYIDQIVRETADFTLAGSNVRCEMSFDDNMQCVEVDKGQVTLVVQDILVNAVHAMLGGGAIRIHGKTVDGRGIRAVEGRPKACVRVSIADDGIGIPDGDLRRVFDPFFSTKGQGRGLGLATSHSIMRRHGGWIDVESSLGNGTIFYLCFPVSTAQLRPEQSRTELANGVGGTVLVMDDESRGAPLILCCWI